MSCEVAEGRKHWRMSCNVGEATKAEPHSPTLTSLQLSHSLLSNIYITSHMSQLILQPFRCFIYLTDTSPTSPDMVLRHSPTLTSLHLTHSSFSNTCVVLPTSQLILQLFRRFTYVTAHSTTRSVASPTSDTSPTSPDKQGRFLKGVASLCYNQIFCSLKLCTTQVKNILFSHVI